MHAAILSCGLFITACSVFDNPVPDSGISKSVDEFWDMPGNAGDSAVVAALKSIENVGDLKPFMNEHFGQAYYFNYRQLVDHNDSTKGTFKQQVVLSFVDKDAPTILHTQGYSLSSESNPNIINNRLDSISAPHLLSALSEDYGEKGYDLNCVQVEYRYHGFSLPEGDRNVFNYLSAEQQSKDLHAIVTDLKKALITGDGKWLSTGSSKGGVTSVQYAYYDEMYGWNDIDVHVPFVAPIMTQVSDIRIGDYMITESSKEALPLLEKAYKKLVDDPDIAQATLDAFYADRTKKGIEINPDSAYLFTLSGVMNNLFYVESYGDFDTWTKLIPTENDKPEYYAYFFMLDNNSQDIYRKSANARGPLRMRNSPFEMQISIDLGNMGDNLSWFLEGKLLSASDKAYLKGLMEGYKNSKVLDLQVKVLKNLETTTKKMIFVYGEDDPWTGAAIPDPKNPNVKKYIVPHGSHTDDFTTYIWYPGGQDAVNKIVTDIVAALK
jgi:hypothetical protein